MAAVSCVFFPFSPASFVAGLINTIGTVAIHAALRASMDKVEMCLNVVVLLGPSNLHPFQGQWEQNTVCGSQKNEGILRIFVYVSETKLFCAKRASIINWCKNYSTCRVPECLSHRRNWAPHPFPRKWVCLPLWTQRGEGATLSCGWEVHGGNKFGRLDRKPGILYTLWLCAF